MQPAACSLELLASAGLPGGSPLACAAQEGWKGVFDTFDTDHDGSISEPEIRAALAKVGVTDAEVASLLEQYDTNKCALLAACQQMHSSVLATSRCQGVALQPEL